MARFRSPKLKAIGAAILASGVLLSGLNLLPSALNNSSGVLAPHKAQAEENNNYSAPITRGLTKGHFSFAVAASPRVAEIGEEITYTYTFINNSSDYKLFWDKAQQVNEIMSDTVCSTITEGKGWKRSYSGWLFIDSNSSAILECKTTFDKPGKHRNNITIQPSRLRKGPANGQTSTFTDIIENAGGAEVYVRPTYTSGNYTITTPDSPGETSAESNNKRPKWKLVKSSNKAYVSPSGEEVTYTYTVENKSGKNLYYKSLKDNHCSPLTLKSPLQTDHKQRHFIKADDKATWTCTAFVNQVTRSIAEGSFYDADGNISYAGVGTYVGVQTPNNTQGMNYGISRCDVIDFTTVNASTGTGTIGSMEAGTVPTAAQEIPYKAGSTPSHFQIPSHKARMTTASATSRFHPEWVYYTPRAIGDSFKYSGDANIGLYRINKATGATVKVTDPHFENDHSRNGATATNRLAFGPDGTLWSFATNGHMYALHVQPDGSAAPPGWHDYGRIITNARTAQGQNVDFANLIYGDIAIDGNNTMWITSSMPIVHEYGPDGRLVPNSVKDETFLFTISAKALLEGKEEQANLINKISKEDEYSDHKGFHGLAFGPNGQLYASYDGSDGKTPVPGEIYTIDLKTGKANHLFTSALLTRVQDLSSCSFPTPNISATKTVRQIPGTTDQLEYTISVSNTGNLAATGIKFSDTFSGTYVPGSAKLNSETWDNFPVPSTNDNQNSEFINSPGAPLGVIEPESSATLSFIVMRPLSVKDGMVCNQADVYVSGSVIKTDDQSVPNGDDPTCIEVPQIEIKKTGGKIEYIERTLNQTEPEGFYKSTYTINVSNVGSVNATYTAFTDKLSYKQNQMDSIPHWPNSVLIRSAQWFRTDKPSDIKQLTFNDATGETIIGDSEVKSLEPATVHTYRVTIIFKPETSWDQVNATKLCNSIELDGDINPANNQVCSDLPKSPLGKVTVQKAEYDPKTDQPKPLENLGGAEFSVYAASADKSSPDYTKVLHSIKYVKDQKPDNGLSFEVKPGQTYFLVETKAPKGLSLLPQPLKLETYLENGAVKAKTDNTLSGTVEGQDNNITITVIDVKTGNLPRSGGPGISLFGILALGLFGVATTLIRRQRNV